MDDKLEKLTGLLLKWGYHPRINTALWSVAGSVMAVDGNPELGLACIPLGIAGDFAREMYENSKVTTWNRRSALSRVLGPDVILSLENKVREKFGYAGKCSIEEDFSKQGGTGIYSKGYLSTLKFSFSDGNSASLIYKYTEKPTLKVGEDMGERLTQLGFEFIPGVIIPGQSYDELEMNLSGNSINKGYFTEWVGDDNLADIVREDRNGKTLRDEILDVLGHLGELYGSTSWVLGDGVLEDAFLEKTIGSVGREGLDKFYSHFREIHDRVFARSGRTQIHGDLHLENILKDEEGKNKVIDWDNAQAGIPYQDFFFCAVWSDFEKDATYESTKEEFCKRQKVILPDVTELHCLLTEFKVYHRTFRAFYSSLERGEISAEREEQMKKICKYLLDKSEMILESYAGKVGDFSVVSKFVEAKKDYELISDVAYNHHVSILEGQEIFNSREQKTGVQHQDDGALPEDIVKNIANGNYQDHALEAENIVADHYKVIGLGLAPLTSTSLLAATGLGMASYLGFDIPLPAYFLQTAMVAGTTFLAVSNENFIVRTVANLLDNAKTNLTSPSRYE